MFKFGRKTAQAIDRASMESPAIIQEKLIFDGDEYEKKLLGCIHDAKKEILITTYIFENDKFGSKVLEALSKKADEGVSIKFIVDGVGSLPWIRDILPNVSCKNMEIRIFHPLPWPFLKPRISTFLNVSKFFPLLYTWNQRCHQKFFVFDEKIAIIGSRNIHQEALDWKELSIVVEGLCLTEVIDAFNQIWIRSHSKLMKRFHYKAFYQSYRATKYVFTNHRLFLRKRTQKAWQDKINQAKTHVLITTPYFFPTHKILKSIYRKARSGVQVAILLPKRTDVHVSKWIAEFHYANLLKSGVKIFEYKPKILHAKSMIVDVWALIGSSNFNQRSFLRDLELDYKVSNDASIEKMVERFLMDIENSNQITVIPEMHIFKKIFIYVAIKLAPTWF